MSNPVIDLTGQRFGRLAAVERTANTTAGKAQWACRCDCGQFAVVPTSSLRRGFTRSCGCLSRELSSERLRSHGLSRTPEFRAWSSMLSRCHRPANQNYAHYGGRGIKVCAEWSASFEAFYEHIGPRPSTAHSLDRIDVDGNYEPGNVRWATIKEQRHNRRDPALTESQDDEILDLRTVMTLKQLAVIYDRGWRTIGDASRRAQRRRAASN